MKDVHFPLPNNHRSKSFRFVSFASSDTPQDLLSSYCGHSNYYYHLCTKKQSDTDKLPLFVLNDNGGLQQFKLTSLSFLNESGHFKNQRKANNDILLLRSLAGISRGGGGGNIDNDQETYNINIDATTSSESTSESSSTSTTPSFRHEDDRDRHNNDERILNEEIFTHDLDDEVPTSLMNNRASFENNSQRSHHQNIEDENVISQQHNKHSNASFSPISDLEDNDVDSGYYSESQHYNIVEEDSTLEDMTPLLQLQKNQKEQDLDNGSFNDNDNDNDEPSFVSPHETVITDEDLKAIQHEIDGHVHKDSSIHKEMNSTGDVVDMEDYAVDTDCQIGGGIYTDDDSTAFVDRMDLADAYDDEDAKIHVHEKDDFELTTITSSIQNEVVEEIDGILGNNNKENEILNEQHPDAAADISSMQASPESDSQQTPIESFKNDTHTDYLTTQNVAITDEMANILVQKLGYTKNELFGMKPHVAAVLVKNMAKRPKGRIPNEFYLPDHTPSTPPPPKKKTNNSFESRPLFLRRAFVPSVLAGVTLGATSFFMDSHRKMNICRSMSKNVNSIGKDIIDIGIEETTDIENDGKIEGVSIGSPAIPFKDKKKGSSSPTFKDPSLEEKYNKVREEVVENRKVKGKHNKALDKSLLDKFITFTLEVFDKIVGSRF